MVVFILMMTIYQRIQCVGVCARSKGFEFNEETSNKDGRKGGIMGNQGKG